VSEGNSGERMPDRNVEGDRGIGLSEEGFDSRCDQTSCAKEKEKRMGSVDWSEKET